MSKDLLVYNINRIAVDKCFHIFSGNIEQTLPCLNTFPCNMGRDIAARGGKKGVAGARGLIIEHIDTGGIDTPFDKRFCKVCGIDHRASRGIDKYCRALHQA